MSVVRCVRRKLAITPRFYQTDMMGVVHNAEYYRWFEDGRLQILEEIMSLQEATALGVSVPVVASSCEYRRPVRYGDRLLMRTEHTVAEPYEGRLAFDHTIVNVRTKDTVATGHTAVTIVRLDSGLPVKQWPAHVWQRYLALHS